MNRSEARRMLSRKFRSQPSKGDHIHFFDEDGMLVFGLAVCSKSNGKALPRSVARKVKELCR